MENRISSSNVQTLAIHTSDRFNSTSGIVPPIWQSSTFRALSSEHFVAMANAIKPDVFYTRYGNPTHRQVEETIAALEGGEAALLTGSGMGAISTAVMSLVETGDHIVAQRSLYAGTKNLLEDVVPRSGVACTFVDQTNLDEFAQAIRPNTRLIYVETPVNPLMRLTDLRGVAQLKNAKEDIITIADNTLATPVNQRPLECGIDVVVHSATKYIGGHSDVTAGVIVTSAGLLERIWKSHLVYGSTLSPFDGWLLLRSLRTFGVRVERHNENAMALAQFLEAHPDVECVNYPGLESHPQHELARRQMTGFTGVLSVELRGDYESTTRFVSRLKLPAYAASMGGVESLVVHPAAMWGKQLSADQLRSMGVSTNLVRISVGLEGKDDLINDFAQALEGQVGSMSWRMRR